MNDKREKSDSRLDYLDSSQVASATECTGLIQGMPIDDSETDSYTDLYPIPEQKPLDPRKADNEDLKDPQGRNWKPI